VKKKQGALAVTNILESLSSIEGFELAGDSLCRTFVFSSYLSLETFMHELLAVLVATNTDHIHVEITQKHVLVRISTPTIGITEEDILLANQINDLYE
jgi:pterin-4a-carbinolamine dehydratase